jgi:uncharacterized membrane protein YdjX (TVP38/TMEM64 family)
MNRKTFAKIAVAFVLAAVVVGIYLSPARDYFTRDNVRAFIGAFMLACVFALPASVFCIAAGFIWGWALGGVYSMIGGLLGAMASFYLGRFVGEGMLEKFGRLGRVVAKQVDHAGFRSLLVLRFIPGIPFAVMNYGAGVAGVRVRDFVGATVLGIIPPMFVFTYCADALFNGSMSEGDAFKRLAIVCALMLALTLLPVVLKRFARPQSEVTGASGE